MKEESVGDYCMSVNIMSTLSNNSPTPKELQRMKSASSTFPTAIRVFEKPNHLRPHVANGGKKTKERRIIKIPYPVSFPQNVFTMPMARNRVPKRQLITVPAINLFRSMSSIWAVIIFSLRFIVLCFQSTLKYKVNE